MRPVRGFLSGVLQGRNWLLAVGGMVLATVASAAVIPNLFPFLDPTGGCLHLQRQWSDR
jgi:hypothetical protein